MRNRVGSVVSPDSNRDPRRQFSRIARPGNSLAGIDHVHEPCIYLVVPALAPGAPFGDPILGGYSHPRWRQAAARGGPELRAVIAG
jgi:hypothetical protein